MPEKITPARTPDVNTPPLDTYTRDDTRSRSERAGQAASEQASKLKNSAAERARDEADTRKQVLASDLKKVSSTLEKSQDDLQDAGWAGHLLSDAAGHLERMAETLERKSPDELMRDVRSFARRNPAAYLAGCAAAGFAAARLARARPEEGGHHGTA